MRNISTPFYTIEELELFIDNNNIKDDVRLLLQVFCANVDEGFIRHLQNFLNQKFPSSSLIGTTTDGLIHDSEIYFETKNVATFSLFEHTRLKTHLISHKSCHECSYEAGVSLASALNEQDAKVLICFADGVQTNGEEFVYGIESVMPNVILAGGLAGDNGEMNNTLIFDKDTVSNSGCVGAVLINAELFIGSDYSFDWIPIGKKMRVTKVIKNRVYELDGQPIVDVYAKYMGKDLANKLPQVGIEFPLIFERDGVTIGRAVLAKHDDGSLTFAGNIDEFSIVRFGVGDIGSILNNGTYTVYSFLEKNKCKAEAVFVYSCMARRRFLSEYAKEELENITKLGPTSGFFTYGEFFHFPQKNQLLNETMTFLAISENCQEIHDFKIEGKLTGKTAFISTQHVLANLANTVSNELAELNKNLEYRIRENSTYMFKQAYFSKLTGLPNRVSLIDALNNHIGEVLVLINVDDFSTINDFYGYKVGDHVLQDIAKVLEKYLKKHKAKVYKLPSDEFALILNIKNHKEEIEKHLKELSRKIEKTNYDYNGYHLHIGVTLAAAIINREKTGLVNADMSLKLAKTKGKSFMIFNEDLKLAQQYEHNVMLANKIKNALDTGNIVPFYQPIIDVNSLEVFKYEALVRLKDENGEVLTPIDFLEASRKIRLYANITKSMIDKIFSFFSENKLQFSLNLDFSDISSEEIRVFLCDRLHKYHIASQLTIEILETQEFEDPQIVHDFVERVSKFNVKIAIDDFGSGFANFEYLTTIKSHYVKIDGSLIKNIDKDKNARIITETIIGFAHKLNKKVIAEFVHSKEVFEVVKELGVDYAQGYYFGEPKETV